MLVRRRLDLQCCVFTTLYDMSVGSLVWRSELVGITSDYRTTLLVDTYYIIMSCSKLVEIRGILKKKIIFIC